ncbi:hypothetical protein CR513_36430, partial [Mucuna pruriens]
MMDRSMIDDASGGTLMDKTPATARHLISNMTSNTQQFGIKGASQPRMVNEISAVDNLRLENRLTELTSLVRQLAVGQHQPSIAARQETESDCPESVGGIGGYQYGKQPYQTISTRADSRAICSPTIWIRPECTSRTNRLSTIDSAISGTTIPITTTKNAS